MAKANPVYRQLVEGHVLDGLFRRHGLSESVERERFEALWRQLGRHAPLFGYADHPDLDSEQLEHVREAVHEQLAEFARNGARRAVEEHAVRSFLAALRSSRGLPRPANPSPELAALIDEGETRLRAAIGCAHVPVAELLGYHRSLARHYVVHREGFSELLAWVAARLEDPDEESAKIVARLRELEPPPSPVAEARAEVEAGSLPGPAIPAELARNPQRLASFVAEQSPERDAELGFGLPLARRWYVRLSAELDAVGFGSEDAAAIGATRSLPALVESAVLVHILGLEDPGQKAVLSEAADHLLLYRMIPAARTVGGRQKRHEPVAAYLSSICARALRPWDFEAPALELEARVVVIALLSELATAKARKLLHQEKKHADTAELRRAVNRALARLPERVRAVSPKQRIDRVAAGFRYLNRARRGRDPRARDLAIVAELLGAAR